MCLRNGVTKGIFQRVKGTASSRSFYVKVVTTTVILPN